MNELLTWGLPLVIALALFTLAYTLLPAASRSGDYWMAAFWFLTGAVVLITRFAYWGVTSQRVLPLRIAICSIVILGLSAITVQTFLSINSKRKALVGQSGGSSQKSPKPSFKVDVPAALPGSVKLDVNVFRTSNSTDDSIFPVVARFENLSQPDGFGETDRVWARIIYKEAVPNFELARVDVGCWIDEPSPDITFPFGKARHLLLGGWHVQGKEDLANEFRVFEHIRDLHRAKENPVKIAGPRKLLLEVTLFSSANPAVSHEYRFELDLLPQRPFQGRLLSGVYGIRDLKPGEGIARTPRIERAGVRPLRVPIDPQTNKITSSNYKGEKNNLVAYLAKFYYAPESDTPDWVYVTAHIRFHHGYGSPPGVYRAFRPVWFETETNKQLFNRAEAHELIIAVGGPGNHRYVRKHGSFGPLCVSGRF